MYSNQPRNTIPYDLNRAWVFDDPIHNLSLERPWGTSIHSPFEPPIQTPCADQVRTPCFNMEIDDISSSDATDGAERYVKVVRDLSAEQLADYMVRQDRRMNTKQARLFRKAGPWLRIAFAVIPFKGAMFAAWTDKQLREDLGESNKLTVIDGLNAHFGNEGLGKRVAKFRASLCGQSGSCLARGLREIAVPVSAAAPVSVTPGFPEWHKFYKGIRNFTVAPGRVFLYWPTSTDHGFF